MSNRLNPFAANTDLVQALIAFGNKVAEAGIEKSLIELVKIRASQLNGCAICLSMHTREARKAGESDERLLMLDAWRESSLYSERERAALAWTESLTLLASSHAPDDVYEQVRAQFTDQESVQLTLMIGVINTFNRLGVGYRLNPSLLERRAA